MSNTLATLNENGHTLFADTESLSIANKLQARESIRISYAATRKRVRAENPELAGAALNEAVEKCMRGYKAAFAAARSEADQRGFQEEQLVRRLADGRVRLTTVQTERKVDPAAHALAAAKADAEKSRRETEELRQQIAALTTKLTEGKAKGKKKAE